MNGAYLALASVATGALLCRKDTASGSFNTKWTYAAAKEYLQSVRNPERGRPLPGKGTRLIERPDGIAVRYHQTDVVLIKPGNRWVVTTGGYDSMTTRQRIEEYSPAVVFGDQSLSWIGARPREVGERWNEMPRYMMGARSFTVNSKGRVLGGGKAFTKAELKSLEKTAREINKAKYKGNDVGLSTDLGGMRSLPIKFQEIPEECFQCERADLTGQLSREDCDAFLYSWVTGVWGQRALWMMVCSLAMRQGPSTHTCEDLNDAAERAFQYQISINSYAIPYRLNSLAKSFWKKHRLELLRHVQKYGLRRALIPSSSLRDLRR